MGGSLEERFRFISLLVEEVTAAVSEYDANNFIVGYRFSPEEIESPGIRFDDTLFLVDQLCQKSLDYLHISLREWDQVSAHKDYQGKPMIAYLNEEIANRLAFISVGDVRTGKDAEKALEHSDLVALGLVLLSDPNWASKVIAKKEEYIRYNVLKEDMDLLGLTNGAWEFMQKLMPDRLQ